MRCRLITRAIALLCGLVAASAFAALTPEQKELDLRIVAAEYAKLYAPYEWKRDVIGFDFYNLSPWIARVRATKSDIEYYEVLGQYVASLQDSHSSFLIHSSFTYSTGMHADIYDGKAIIDSISRTSLPVSRFPFQIGDEVVLVNGRPVEEVIDANVALVVGANVWSRRRRALQRVFSGAQSNNPLAYKVGDTVEVTIKSRTTGAEQAYTIPVIKSGVPLSEGGTTPSPVFRASPTVEKTVEPDDYFPPWVTALAPLQQARIQTETDAVLNFGSQPAFVLPPGFVQRQGRLSSDEYFSGTFNSGTTRIGYLRIPTFAPRTTTATALRQFETEMQFFNQNTDGLILDIMRNPGGGACYMEELLRRLIPGGFRSILFEIRGSYRFATYFEQAIDALTQAQAPPQVIAAYRGFLDEVLAAQSRPRGRTAPLPLCSDSRDRTAAAVVYTKPAILLVDEFSASGSDAFSANFQDSRRGLVFGFRTNGAGGTIEGRESGPYSEFYSYTTLSLMFRPNEVAISNYPVTHYIENVGVWPDVPYNYMSLDNLLGGGIPFRDSAIATLVGEITQPR
ncbi:MAG TPA: S41 family peptidase [Bryobacteraceae bacterium]|nr:S41 family peptidase [Bryobacteraceae bacterium]